MPIEKLLGVVALEEEDNNPIVVNLKVEGKSWQRFFLDAWIGCWEDWGKLVDEEDGETRFVDYAEKYSFKGSKIKLIKCQDCRVLIKLESNQLFTLKLVDPEQSDTYSEVVFSKLSA